MKSAGIVWAQYGPYHFARVAALRARARHLNIHAIQIGEHTCIYQWKSEAPNFPVNTICSGATTETARFREVFSNARSLFSKLELDLCFLPGYLPRQSLAVLLAAKSLNLKTVLMTESHAGTARRNPLVRLVKRALVGFFDVALVGGEPQKKYCRALGMANDRIFTGYDAIDNDYFETRADQVRAQCDHFRNQFALPSEYILSLGRFDPKKNLLCLIKAYHWFRRRRPWSKTHLVIVGSGDEEARLESLCWELRLPVYNKQKVAPATSNIAANDVEPGVHFYGFRQIDQNPIFYALAKAFVLPSLSEEWGLVVNEAMACGLPVVVSDAVGSAEDLLPRGDATTPGQRENGFVFDPKCFTALSSILEYGDGKSDLLARMGVSSRRIIRQFSCDKFAENAIRAADLALSSQDFPCDISTSLNRSSL